VVFWIGWTLPASFDRGHDLADSSQQPDAATASGSGPAVTVQAPIAFVPSDQPSPAAAPQRHHTNLLDLNRATEKDFDALPGIGPRLAERILAHRQSVGAFQSLDELRKVKGIGEQTLAKIRPLVTVMPDAKPVGTR
jgi:competence protein ComEA